MVAHHQGERLHHRPCPRAANAESPLPSRYRSLCTTVTAMPRRRLTSSTCRSIWSARWPVTTTTSYDAVVRAAVAWALGTGPEIYRHVEVANCSITTVGVVAGVRRLVRTNENAHLEGLALEP